MCHSDVDADTCTLLGSRAFYHMANVFDGSQVEEVAEVVCAEEHKFDYPGYHEVNYSATF